MIHIAKPSKLLTTSLAGVLILLTAVASGWLLANFTNPASAARKEDWIAGNIISDAEFANPNGMTVAEIQAFLDRQIGTCDVWGTGEAVEYHYTGYRGTRAGFAAQQGWPGPPYTCLNMYYEVPKVSPGGTMPANNYSNPSSRPGGSQSAAWIIKDAANRYNLNPKVLLVKLATESAGPLTADKWPLFSQYRFAMGAHCPDSGPGGSANCDPAYSGFSLQMYKSAELMRWYLNSMDEPWWQYKRVGGGRDQAISGKDICSDRNGVQNSNCIGWNVAPRGCGGTVINIQSRATAALYTYTPYQPNHAALNNMYGTGDYCSAYGNRNFWRVYWDWFGDTRNSQPYRWSLSSVNIYADAARTQRISDSGRVTLQPGQVAYATVKAENTGSATWDRSTILETTNHSTIRGSDWIAYNKTSTAAEGDIATGRTGTYNFAITAPSTAGSYTQHLNLHHNNSLTWFNSTDLSIRVMSVAPIPHPGTTAINMLAPREVMRDGDIKYSPERHSVLRFSRGELQLYTNFKKVWSSNTSGDANARLANQSDGNLVIYNGDGKVLWASDTDGAIGATLSIQTDGNVVLYKDGAPIWATHTATSSQLSNVNTTLPVGGVLFPGQRLTTVTRQGAFTLQGDGNLVLYNAAGRAIWASHTDGSGADRAIFQADGNFVLYDAKGRAVWASHTDSKHDGYIVMQGDMNTVMYSRSGQPLWATGTAGR